MANETPNNLQDFQIKDLYKKHEETNIAVGDIKKTVDLIKDNHLAHMNIDLISTKTNVEWLLKTYWIIATASIGGLVAALINLFK